MICLPVGAIIQGARLSWCDGCGCYRLNRGEDFARVEEKQLCHKCAAVARQSEPEAEDIPVNLTIDDMEWEASMVFGYDGWEDEGAA